MSLSPEAIRARAAGVRATADTLRKRPLEERVRWLARAARALEPDAPLGREGAAVLPQATGLSEPMVRWALQTTLGSVQADAMRALVARARATPGPGSDRPALVAVVLAANVFTAAVRALFVPLLFGSPVLVKSSSRERTFPSLLREALHSADRELGNSIDVVSFAGGDEERERALVELADSVSVFGSDDTVQAVADRAGKDKTIWRHGHGVSTAFCGALSIRADELDETTAKVALDVCAYDQRGCLSPQVVYVEDTATGADRFASALSASLGEVSSELPRGPLPPAVGAAQSQWRGMAEVEGRLLTGKDHAVAIRPDGGFRWSPGYRNVTVVPVDRLETAFASMAEFRNHLRCVGVDARCLAAVGEGLASRPTWPAYATDLGTMQTPALDAPADGRPVWSGLTTHPQTPMKRR